MLSIYTMGDFIEYQTYKQLYGGDVAFIGFPTQSKNGSAMSVQGGLAMSSSCENKEGAWQLMRTILTEDYQTNNVWWGFPTNQDVFKH
jgi:ABC-type glycerol-3-phosphate transport system substrate-binding protein